MQKKMFEDTKGVIRSCNSKKNRQYMAKRKRTRRHNKKIKP